MKKFICALLVVLTMAMCLIGCGNQTFLDTTWTFERAIIFLPDGEKIEGPVTSWTDFDGSDMMQVTIEGVTYLTHSSNVVLISDK